MKTLKGFPIGMRVTLTLSSRASRAWRIPPASRVGTVVGASRYRDCVAVVWDGNSKRSRDIYHKSFLTPLRDGKEAGNGG